MSDIGVNYNGIPYQSVLFVATDVATASGCVLNSNSHCDIVSPGVEWKYDGIQWYVYSDTSVCCGYVPESTVVVEQFAETSGEIVTVINEPVDDSSNQTQTPSTIQTSSTGGGLSIPIMAAVGVIAIAGIVMTTQSKKTGGTT